MLCVDFHCHSIASGHAMNTIEELLRHADRKGIKGIAITDHCPGIDNTFWLLKNKPDLADWKHNIKGPDIHYIKTFVSRYQPPEEIKTKLFKGLECNILQSGSLATDLPASLSTKLDLVIASLHPLPPLFETKDKTIVTERVLLAMEEPIDVIGHPFRKGYDPDPELLVRKAIDKEMALELNNASISLKKTELSSLKRMLELSKSLGCQIVLSSDAHTTSELGRDEGILPLLTETDFPDELIVNKTIESSIRFIERRKTIRREMNSRY